MLSEYKFLENNNIQCNQTVVVHCGHVDLENIKAI